MRYIGGKTDLLATIFKEIQERGCQSVLDAFSGSGAVSNHLASLGLTVKSNDLLYFSYILSRGLIYFSQKPEYANLPIKNPISYLNNLDLKTSGIDKEKCFIWMNYAPHGKCKRMYFQESNAMKIDVIRITIEEWKNKCYLTDNEYFYLLSRLISAIPYVSNIAGVYGAYLKHWDARSFKPLELTEGVFSQNMKKENRSYNVDYKEFLKITDADLLYADPPYNHRQYLPNYHILETVARYDYPEIHGISGMRNYGKEEKSNFCISTRVASAFEDLIRSAQVRHIIISYNNEGLMPSMELTSLCQAYAKTGTFKLIEIPYRRYKCHGRDRVSVTEQMYMFEKK